MTTRFVKAGVLTVIGLAAFGAAPTAQDEPNLPVTHVLLLSVDGLHASDLDWYTATFPGSALATLRLHGRTYANATATRPSDSFPGTLAMVTGGTPRSTGVYYDDSWDRSLAGDVTKPCAPGVEVVWKQGLDTAYPVFPLWQDYLNYWVGPSGHAGALNPNKLPRDPSVQCASPIYPHQYPRVNNVFELIRATGGRTAWSDKHPAYEFLKGPSNTGLDDLYTPEIATPIGGITITNSFDLTMKYDNLKRDAILHQIDGLDHTGAQVFVGVPTLFGMNFQAVSVGQKLKAEQYPFALDPTLVGGYMQDLNGNLVPKSGLVAALHNTDAAIAMMMSELANQGLADSTLIILSAKHGNSPIDPATLVRLNASTITAIVNSVGSGLLAIPPVADTGPLLWLTPAGQARIDDIVAAFNASIAGTNPAHLAGVLAKDDLAAMFADPLTDARAPDLILFPIPGTVYTSPTGTKIADHGSFGEDDVHVALLVSNPNLPSKTIDDPVETRQIACTILKALAMECDGLQSEQIEPSKFLPNANHKNADSSGPGVSASHGHKK